MATARALVQEFDVRFPTHADFVYTQAYWARRIDTDAIRTIARACAQRAPDNATDLERWLAGGGPHLVLTTRDRQRGDGPDVMDKGFRRDKGLDAKRLKNFFKSVHRCSALCVLLRIVFQSHEHFGDGLFVESSHGALRLQSVGLLAVCAQMAFNPVVLRTAPHDGTSVSIVSATTTYAQMPSKSNHHILRIRLVSASGEVTTIFCDPTYHQVDPSYEWPVRFMKQLDARLYADPRPMAGLDDGDRAGVHNLEHLDRQDEAYFTKEDCEMLSAFRRALVEKYGAAPCDARLESEVAAPR